MSLDKTYRLIDKIIEQRNNYLKSKIQRYPARTFRASDINECDRRMVYSVLNWQEKALHDEGLQAIFDAGNKEEENVKRRLSDSGFEVIQSQTPFEIKNRDGEVICTGHIDGKILFEGSAICFEAKSMNQNIFNGIKSLEDFNKKPHLKKYLSQIQLYLFGNNEEAGFFILSDFRTEKYLPVVLDYGECERILQKLERCWGYVKRKEYPEKIEYNNQLCDKCPFTHICLPDVANKGANIINNEELEITLDRREELKLFVSEFEEIDETIKSTFKGVPESYVGSKYQIISSCRRGVRVDTKSLPDTIRSQYSIPTETWTVKINKLDGGQNGKGSNA